MNRIMICIALILLLPEIAFAENGVPSDRELFEELYSQGLRELLPESAPEASRELLPAFAGGIAASGRIRTVTETVLSTRGYSISDRLRENGCTLTLMLSEARCTLSKDGKAYERFVSLTLHARCTDHSGTILFARSCERTAHDRIPGNLRKSTDTGKDFSPEITRTVVNHKPNTRRIASFLILSAALGFFAFQK